MSQEAPGPVPDPQKPEEGKLTAVMAAVGEKSAVVKDVLVTKGTEYYEKIKEHEKVQEYLEYGDKKKDEWLAYGGEKKEQIGQKVGEYKEKVGEKYGEIKEKVGEKTGEYYERGSIKAQEAYDKAMEIEKVRVAVEKGAVIAARASEVKGKVVSKTKEKAELAKARTKALWARGKGKIIKIKNDVKENWGKSAQETLLLKEESKKKWDNLKLRGAEDITVPARSEFTTCFLIEKGTIMRWSFRVKDFDVGFGVRLRIMRDFGSVEEDVLPVERFDSVDTVEGSWIADQDRQIVLVFDNSYSKLRSKTVAYLVGTEKATQEEMVEVQETEKVQETEFLAEEQRIESAEEEPEAMSANEEAPAQTTEATAA